MTKLEMTEAIFEAKIKKGATWKDIGDQIGLSNIFTSSACLGQNSLNKEDATKLCAYLNLGDDIVTALMTCPMKGMDTDLVSKDPLIYRFYEIAYVYGGAIKECIHEQFGDGIMSAIDFTCDITKQEDPNGDRVVVTMNGKFLPYKKW